MKPPELVPEDAEQATFGEPSRVAGGAPSVLAALRFASKEMGLVRGTRTLLRANQKNGFDCPGCAWPEPKDRSLVEFCENGAKAIASEATTKRADPAFFARHSIEDLAAQSDAWLNDQGRITHPMVLRPGATHYEPVAWEDAFELVASELRALASPDEAIFYTSGRTSNEAAFLYQLFVRQLGTNNLPDCSNMCHESSGTGLREVIGVGKGTVTLEDFDRADAIVVVGQNPGTNHPRMLTTLEQAAKRGCRIVSINPLPEVGNMRFAHPQDPVGLLGGSTVLSTLFLQVRVNGDVALFQGIAKEMLDAEERAPGTVLDRAFIDAFTDGFEAYAKGIRAAGYDELVEASGVARDGMREAARVLVESKATIVCWAMGLTQHENAVANVQEIVNLLLMRGSLGKPGAGACPVRGHSNVQGDRTMGIWEKVDGPFLDRLGHEFLFEPPRHHGLDTVESIRAMLDGRIKVFFAMGGNFLSATPDTEATARALRACRLTAAVSTKLNRGHLVTGKSALVLPCLGRTERDVAASGDQVVTVENSMGVVHTSRGALDPASPELRSEVAIVCGLARAALGDRSRVPWGKLAGDYRAIREHIGRVVAGFDGFNARIEKDGSFLLPNAARDRVFKTATGKARFTVHPLPRHDLAPGELMMMTVRSHDQYNTTVYAADDRYRGVHEGRRVVLMNADDVAEAGLAAGDLVDLVSRYEGARPARGDGMGVCRVAPRFKVVPYAIPRRCAATYFPEANVLVPLDSVAAKSNTPASKSVVITVRKANPKPA
jgi:molybdopterin-dependent oxidoreductase alpha subunit